MMTYIQIKAWLSISEKLLLEALVQQNTARLIELLSYRALMKDELIKQYERRKEVRNETRREK